MTEGPIGQSLGGKSCSALIICDPVADGANTVGGIAALTKGKRNAEATQAAILVAAQKAFTDHGFDGVGLREIAAAANVNVALVNRYFGSKKGLFNEAIASAISASNLLPSDRSLFCRHLASQLVSSAAGDDASFDPTRAMIRSAGNVQAEELMRAALEERFVSPLAGWLGGEDAAVRSSLIVTLVAGVAVLRDVLRLPSLLREDGELEVRLEALLRSLVDSEHGANNTSEAVVDGPERALSRGKS